jgi:hypothetical protein
MMPIPEKRFLPSMRKTIITSRLVKQFFIAVVDSLTLVLILLAAFSIRLGYWFFPESDLLWVFFGTPIIAMPIFIKFGLYRTVIRYLGFDALWEVFKAVSLYALIWGLVGFMAAIDGLPRSVILINWVLSLLFISGIRLLAYWYFSDQFRKSNTGSKNVIIYGAGSALVDYFSVTSWIKMLASHEIAHNYQLNAKDNEVSKTLHKVLKNNPFPIFAPIPLFTLPNLLLPTALLEGDSVLNESIRDNGGRLFNHRFKAITLSLIKHNKITPTTFINDHIHFPYLEEKYILGSYLQRVKLY